MKNQVRQPLMKKIALIHTLAVDSKGFQKKKSAERYHSSSDESHKSVELESDKDIDEMYAKSAKLQQK